MHDEAEDSKWTGQLRLPEELREAVARAAKAEKRPRANWVAVEIEGALRRKGFLVEEPAASGGAR